MQKSFLRIGVFSTIFALFFILLSCGKSKESLQVDIAPIKTMDQALSSSVQRSSDENDGEEGEEGEVYDAPVIASDTQISIHPLILKFSNQDGSSPANLDLLDTPITEGITLVPNIKGEWRWSDENTLRFQPTVDWSAGTEYKVTIAPTVFNINIPKAQRTYKFKTPEFLVKLRSSNISKFPNEGATVRFTANIVFTHEVDKKSFEKVSKLTVDDRDVKYKITYDKYGLTANILSDPIAVKSDAQKVLFSSSAIEPENKGDQKASFNKIRASQVVDSSSEFFKIINQRGMIARDDKNNPQQIIMIELSDEAKREDVAKNIEIYLLPRYIPNSDESSSWNIDVARKNLNTAQRLKTLPIESGELTYPFLIDVENDSNFNRYVYVRLKAGMVSKSGFLFSKTIDFVQTVPRYKKEISIVGDGAILSLYSDKILTFASRGNRGIKVKVGRILDNQIQHIINFTSNGGLKNTNFYGNADIDNFATFTETIIPLANKSAKDVDYVAVDLTKQVASKSDVGLFYISAYGCANSECKYAETDAIQRLILVTDIGIIMKENTDRSSTIFATSISTGKSVAGASVKIIGKNGLPVFQGMTDINGYFKFPALDNLYAEKAPIAVLVSKGADTSFIPMANYSNYGMRVDYSKFDIGGVYPSDYQDGINGYLFTDRGIYRPSETVRLMGIAKQQDWKSLAGVPLGIHVRDPNDKIVLTNKFSLINSGLFTSNFKTEQTSLTGVYSYELYTLDSRDNFNNFIGRASFKVEEFEPDTMKVTAKINGKSDKGWQNPHKVNGYVKVENLFGTAATDRRVKWDAILTPTSFEFADYRGYNFTDPLYEESARVQNKKPDIEETLTDKNGESSVDLKLENFIGGTYRLRVSAEAFQGNSGDSVISGDFALISPLDYVVGYKSDNNLTYISRDAKSVINFIALDNELKKINLDSLTLKVMKLEYVQSMVRTQSDGYRYQTVLKSNEISSSKFAIASGGSQYTLPTNIPGGYAIELSDKSGKLVSKVVYMVAGNSAATGGASATANLQVTLNKQTYKPGENIELNIVAPYTGFGLITIEKERVYAYKWFKADTLSSTHQIAMPNSLEANGYINVSFLRDPSSKEVFISPHSYAVVPFKISLEKRQVNVDLNMQEIVQPGEEIKINYKTDKDTNIIIYGVDEGILQVAGYRTPNPLAHFFKKKALTVKTDQTIDLILPNYSVIKKYFATGGDSEAIEAILAGLNPFARKVAKPVVFFSGILTAKAGEDNIYKYTVPSYFNGRVRVMAVASSTTGVGSSEKYFLSKAPIILTPSVPPAALKNDEFEVPLNIVNNIDNSASAEQIKIAVTVTPNLEIIGSRSETVSVEKNLEKRLIFKVRVKDKLGNATITFTAQNDKLKLPITASSSLSVRPTVPYVNSVNIGRFATKDFTIKDNIRSMYSEFSKREISASSNPLVAMGALASYLNDYDYICTEQIVSKVYPQLFGADGNGITKVDESDFMRFINTLRGRQNNNGGFALWPNGATDPFVSVYVANFLVDASIQSLPLQNDDMLSSLSRWLLNYSLSEPKNFDDARLHARAIYVITKNGTLATKQINALEEYLNANHKNTWKSDITAAYLGAAYLLMKDKSGKGMSLIDGVKVADDKYISYSDFDDSILRESQYLYIMAAHAPELLSKDAMLLDRLYEYLADDHYTTVNSASLIVAFANINTDATDVKLDISEVGRDGKSTKLSGSTKPFPKVKFNSPISALNVKSSSIPEDGFFFTLNQGGYDMTARSATSSGLEIRKDYLNAKGEKITSAKTGDEVTVKIYIRSTTDAYYNNVVLTDILPTGFEVNTSSVTAKNIGYTDIREDRVLVFLAVGKGISEVTYKAKLLTTGEFTSPAAYATSMYHRKVFANTEEGKFKVEANVKTDVKK